MPECSRCTLYACISGLVGEQETANEINSNRSQCTYDNNNAGRLLTNHQPLRNLSGIEATNPNFLSLQNASYSNAPLPTNSEFDQYITAYAYSIFGQLGIELKAVVDLHRDSLYSWLPIVNPVQFHQRVTELAVTASAETAVLILYVSLANPSTLIPETKQHEFLYDKCRSLFLLLQAIRSDSVATVQAGVLLTLYEQGRGLLSSAHTTLRICAKLWHATGLYQQHALGISARSDEMQQLWWAIYMLDRLHCLETVPRAAVIKKPQTPHNISVDDCLRDQNLYRQYPPTSHLAEDLNSKPNKCFTHQILAFGLLDEIIMHQSWHEPSIQSSDALLQRMLSTIFNNVGNDWVPEYNVVVILLLYADSQTRKLCC